MQSADRPVGFDQLASVVYAAERSSIPAVLGRQLAAALDADLRFCRDQGQVSLAAWEMRDVALQHAEFVALDVESNGGASGRHRIIELGAVRFGVDGIRGRFQTLVAAPAPIARAVTAMTGIEDEMLCGAPSPAKALESLAEFCLGAVLVAHNLASDLNYINQEAHWAGLPTMSGDGLDTMAIAAWQHPDGGPFGLARTLSLYGLAEQSLHRAGSDAESVREIFLAQIEHARGAGVGKVGQLRQVCQSALTPDPHLARLLDQAAKRLPALPGTYQFIDVNGKVLYVGMANSLQRRVRQHLANSNRHARRRDGLLEKVDRIEHQVCGSELAAMISEQDLITGLDPPFNRQKRSHRGPHYVALSMTGNRGQLRAVAQPLGTATACAGPFRAAASARELASRLRSALEISARWDEAGRPSASGLAAAAAFLRGGMVAARRELGGHDDPQAARYLRRLNSRGPWPRPLPGGMAGRPVIAVTHSDIPGQIAIWLIAAGAVIAQRAVPQAAEEMLSEAVEELVATPIPEPGDRPDAVGNRVDRWLISNVDRPNVIWIDGNRAKIVAQAKRAARRLWT